MLSIKVALDLFILVGFVIVGSSEFSKVISMKFWVFLWDAYFNRSKLWSNPNISSLFLSFFILDKLFV